MTEGVPEHLWVEDQGKPSEEINVYQQADANSVALQNQVSAALADFMKTQPKSIHLVKWYDQTELVRSSAAAVEEAILIGLLLAALVLLLFLRNWRATLVAMLVVPMSMLITVLLLYVLGMSFNIMTLGGLAAAVGLLIGDVIVMIEQIARRAPTFRREHCLAKPGGGARWPGTQCSDERLNQNLSVFTSACNDIKL